MPGTFDAASPMIIDDCQEREVRIPGPVRIITSPAHLMVHNLDLQLALDQSRWKISFIHQRQRLGVVSFCLFPQSHSAMRELLGVPSKSQFR
ncbi:hypothetical protein BJX61DRAFT_519820, partial [Aspergillus egyptiacus]